jgi:formate hydrogenlyase transcriptional activator
MTGEQKLIGTSPTFMSALHQVEMVASGDCAVLLQGETGTGKELFARAVHEQSPRRGNPFVKINCAAIPSELLESELFGHTKGAFTGALTQTTGRFQLAHRGTLFLDEIGDLPLELQPKLLRVLQEREFERLGSSQTIPVDVRVVAATNQDLRQMVDERRYRADLFYRLNVFPILVPPLRDRLQDIPSLIRHFVQYFASRMNKQIDEIPQEAITALQFYDWPGNIRELQNFIERAVIRTPGRVLHVPLTDFTRVMSVQPSMPVRTLAELERASIVEALTRTNWVVGGQDGAAAQLGLPRTTLISRMHKYGIPRHISSPIVSPGGFETDDERESYAGNALGALA